MARVRFWWNGKWGRLARRDVMIHHEPETWVVEAREGGVEGRSKRYDAANADDAERIARRFMLTDEHWREMTQ